MILSMTGYGCASILDGGCSYLVEMRSVNHRYLKLAFRLPEAWQHIESAIDKIVRGRITRGSVTCAVRLRMGDEMEAAPLDVSVAQQYVDRLRDIKTPEGVGRVVDLAVLASLPGVYQANDPGDDVLNDRVKLVCKLCEDACDALTSMRMQEGAALRDALLAICVDVRLRLSVIAERAPLVIGEYHDRLSARVGALMERGGFELQADALAREVALYAERCDIGEELTRLSSHLDQFSELCDRPEPVGRKLDFLTQELLREANTIGSKSNDAHVTREVVEIKGQIDRLKEQVQNVE